MLHNTESLRVGWEETFSLKLKPEYLARQAFDAPPPPPPSLSPTTKIV